MTDEEKTYLLLKEIRKRQSWWRDLSANVAGNAVFEGFTWLVSKLMKKL